MSDKETLCRKCGKRPRYMDREICARCQLLVYGLLGSMMRKREEDQS